MLQSEPREALSATVLIAELKFRDLAATRQLLDAPELEIRRRGLQVILADQRLYRAEDVEHLEDIATLCSDATVFPSIVTFVAGSGKGLFRSNDRLVCECKTERPATLPICTNYNCQRDQRGFRAGDVTPEAAKQACLAEATTLRRLFAEIAESVVDPGVDSAVPAVPLA